MQKRVAILYDFDFTLSINDMGAFGLCQDLGYENVTDFYRANDDLFGGKVDTDICLALMGGILHHAKKRGKVVTKEYLSNFGKNIEFYKGVEEWFNKINAFGKKCGLKVEHYIVSSGLKEIIEGTTIAKHFKRIYANFYAYDESGVAVWPSQVVNYTNKTQYIYRVRKNVLDNLASLKEVNEKMSDSKVLSFSNMIYIGDSFTDIPSFKIIKNGGGRAICVYDENNENSKKIAMTCLKDGRVNAYFPADYTENGKLFNYVKQYILSITEQV